MNNTLDLIIQFFLAVLSISAMFLIAKKNKWGFVVGLASQPFWFITAFLNQQIGVFLVAIAYTFTWVLGINEWFFKKNKPPERNQKKKRK